jgi:hypothetical protein
MALAQELGAGEPQPDNPNGTPKDDEQMAGTQGGEAAVPKSASR